MRRDERFAKGASCFTHNNTKKVFAVVTYQREVVNGNENKAKLRVEGDFVSG